MHPFDDLPESTLAVAHSGVEVPLESICSSQPCPRCQRKVPANWRLESEDLFGCPFGVPWCEPGE